MENKSTYQVENFNRGKLFAVTCTLTTGESQLLSNYYKTKSRANKELEKIKIQSGVN